jgi:hypothetical protein
VRVDSWSIEFVVRQSSAGKNVSMEAMDMVGPAARKLLVKTEQTEKTLCVL